MNIVELAKEVDKAYKECIKHQNSYDCCKGLGEVKHMPKEESSCCKMNYYK